MSETVMNAEIESSSELQAGNVPAPQREHQLLENQVDKTTGALQYNGKSQVQISNCYLICFLCRNPFNLSDRLPLMVCANQHTYCRSCVIECRKYTSKCPECRCLCRQAVRNFLLINLLEMKPQVIPAQKLVIDPSQITGSDMRRIKNKNSKNNQFFYVSRKGFEGKSWFQMKIRSQQLKNVQVGICSRKRNKFFIYDFATKQIRNQTGIIGHTSPSSAFTLLLNKSKCKNIVHVTFDPEDSVMKLTIDQVSFREIYMTASWKWYAYIVSKDTFGRIQFKL